MVHNCNHALPATRINTESDLPPDPTGPQKCHIYYVHQEGPTFCEANVDLKKPQSPAKDSNNLAHPKDYVDNTICGDDRLTLIHLPTESIPILNIPNYHDNNDGDPEDPWPEPDPIPEMPDYFAQKLSKICPDCSCKAEILWRNFHRPEPHFDACFRYKGEDSHRCFLKLYSLTGPYHIGRKGKPQTIVVSMALHIRVEQNRVVHMPHTKSKNKEHIIAFVAGFTSSDMGKLLLDYFMRWQDIPEDHLGSAGMTPKLFLAAGLSQYGSSVGHEIMRAAYRLVKCDQELESNLEKLNCILHDESARCATQEITQKIHKMNMLLINMNRKLTGTRSTMHYLADTADLLVKRVSAFETSVEARIGDWTHNKQHCVHLMSEVRKLDCFKESIRDTDKLELVSKSMTQYKVDIETLQQHIDITVSMVHNLVSERDRKLEEHDRWIGLSIEKNTSKDSFVMKLFGLLGSIFLPATFMANFFAAPIFDWDSKDTSFIRKLPFELYWGITTLMTVLLITVLWFVKHPEWVMKIMESVPSERLKNSLMASNFYGKCSVRNDENREEEDLRKERVLNIRIDKRITPSLHIPTTRAALMAGSTMIKEASVTVQELTARHHRSGSLLPLRVYKSAPSDIENFSNFR